jgi:2-iminobutanoate/2-iminopropanoate deaminase
MIERIFPPGAPTPKGPYSPAVRAGDFIFLSGQVAPEPGDIKHETRQVLGNLKLVLEGAGASLADVAKMGVYLLDGADFAAMNEIYTEVSGTLKPARTTIVCSFMSNIRIEVDCIAYKPK